MCFAWISEQTAITSLYSISEQTAIISLYSINLSVFKTEAECLLRGTKWAFKSDRHSFVLKWLNKSPTFLQINTLWTFRQVLGHMTYQNFMLSLQRPS